MEVEKKMQYKAEGIDLKPGLQRLDGKDALGYVRYRSDGDDTTRIARQQKFMKELIEEVLQLSTIWKLPKLVTEVNQCVTTNLSYTEMLGLANAMRKLDSSAIEGQMLPGRPQYINNISYWLPDFDALEELIDLYTGKTQPETGSEETAAE
jgi:anionic cell wall polymer biosynthesis LytR-Cps2A-Psr (LCP) family protein